REDTERPYVRHNHLPARSFQPRREHRLKMRALLCPGHDADFDLPEPASFQELMQLHFAEAEPMVCIQFAGLFEPVTQQIKNYKAPPPLQYSMSGVNSALRMNGVMQRLTQDCKVDAI